MSKKLIDCIKTQVGLDDLELDTPQSEILKSYIEKIQKEIDELEEGADVLKETELIFTEEIDKIKFDLKKALYDRTITEAKGKGNEQILMSKVYRSGKAALREFKAFINGKLEASFASTADAANRKSNQIYFSAMLEQDKQLDAKLKAYYSDSKKLGLAARNDGGAMMKAIYAYTFMGKRNLEAVGKYLKKPEHIELAKNMGEALMRGSEYHRSELVGLGMVMGKIDGYIGKQGFSKEVVGNVRPEDFIEDLKKNADLTKMFRDWDKKKDATKDNILGELYNQLTGTSNSGAGAKSAVSKTRNILYKSAESSAYMNNKYGTKKTPMDIMRTESNDFSSNVAAWTWTGPNATAAKDNLIKAFAKTLEKNDISYDERTKLEGKAKVYMNKYIDAIMGGNNYHTDDVVKSIGVLKKLQYFSLGSVIKTALPADATQRLLTNLAQGQGF